MPIRRKSIIPKNHVPGQKKRSKDVDLILTTLRLPVTVKAAAQLIADAERRSLSATMVIAIEEYVKREQRKGVTV